MKRVQFTAQSLFVVTSASLALAVAGCADSGGPPPARDTGPRLDGAMDGGAGDVLVLPDTPIPSDDTGTDGGPPPTLTTCEACGSGAECLSGFCARLVDGSSACLPGCDADLPDCPRNAVGEFSCILDATGTGISATICAPVGGPCCVDEDGDGYGTGVGCDGTDCNDTDPDVHPDRTEICDGIDTNCNGVVDEPPTDCEGGYCNAAATGGTYEQTTSARCASAACGMGTTTSCGLYTCADGAGDGLTCATTCADPTDGSDNDIYCIAGAHCEVGSCVADVPDGGTCDEDSDCATSHCDSDVCCASGDCCVNAADCPGGGAVTRLCDMPTDCQGHRGEATCGTDFRCLVTSGIEDDTACDAGVTARDCGLFDPIVCTGAASQTSRACPTSCLVDTDCIEAAHCSVGYCVPDLPPGGPCARGGDCQAGLFCADNVCCTSSCTGSCEACNLPGSAGTCGAVPAGGDPAGECAGFSCSGYYSLSGDVCSRRTDVSDAAAVCDGAGMCRSPDVLCPAQPPGALYSDCNDLCQTLRGGTCTGTVAAICDNSPPATTPLTTSCGVGACQRTVTTCTSGMPTPCVAGTPTTETCNTLDDNCNGVPDDGAPASLCASAPFADMYACTGGTCSFTCASGRYNVNGTYADGCECTDDAYGNACAGATSLAALTPGQSTTVNGAILPDGEIDWFSISFPSSGRGPALGNPQIRLTGPNASSFVLDFYSSCGTGAACGTGASSGVGSYSFVDNQSIAGVNEYSGPHTIPWPMTVVFSVRRVSPATNCAGAAYSVTISR